MHHVRAACDSLSSDPGALPLAALRIPIDDCIYVYTHTFKHSQVCVYHVRARGIGLTRGITITLTGSCGVRLVVCRPWRIAPRRPTDPNRRLFRPREPRGHTGLTLTLNHVCASGPRSLRLALCRPRSPAPRLFTPSPYIPIDIAIAISIHISTHTYVWVYLILYRQSPFVLGSCGVRLAVCRSWHAPPRRPTDPNRRLFRPREPRGHTDGARGYRGLRVGGGDNCDTPQNVTYIVQGSFSLYVYIYNKIDR